jgi:hypothetical protein
MMVRDKGREWSGYGEERQTKAVTERGREKEITRDKSTTDD